MPRAPRLQVPGGIYHVTCRGARGSWLYVDVDDRRAWLDILGIVVYRTGIVCHSYCEMGTHYHLAVETPEPNIADAMQRLNWLYSRSFNTRHGTKGHLFEDRYGATPIESEEHFLATIRYVARNPVEAGICSAPADWEWSSYRALVGLARRPHFLTTTRILGTFGRRRDLARQELRRVIEAPGESDALAA
jgi:REP element-mobilizing transposase RayT